jgi:hypothetical protein
MLSFSFRPLKKCKFASSEIEYLGHVLGKDGVKPTPKHLEAIREYPVPCTTGELRQFLGLVGYYRRFVLGFSDVARPLTDLTKDKPFKEGDKSRVWTAECQRAFEQLKCKLMEEPCLAFPDWKLPFRLYTDASDYGLGAVLSQQQADGSERVVLYLSRLMDKHERNYTVSEKEMLAAVWAIGKCRPYLYGRPFQVVTDHAALQYLQNLKNPTGRLARWALALSDYSPEFVYRKGSLHVNADALSRVMWGLTVAERHERVTAKERIHGVAAVTTEGSPDIFPQNQDLLDDVDELEFSKDPIEELKHVRRAAG